MPYGPQNIVIALILKTQSVHFVHVQQCFPKTRKNFHSVIAINKLSHMCKK